uniref:Fatty acyl-CoA reductase n=1 Tax=Glossina brevipalpis TaxID=37001 RepID=A0A1A9WT59_9MUSC
MQNSNMKAPTVEDVNNEKSEVASWYAGKNVLITGATGFMGKVLVEKLLRSCPNIKRLYLIVRPKKGLTAEARKQQYFKCVIFHKILDKNPDIINKVHVIKGDLLEDDLGINIDQTKHLITNIEIIFHCAANVRFDQPLRPMVEMNVIGTLKLLKLAEKMEKLKSFTHVSTTYCQCNESVLEEHGYPAPQNPYEIIKMIKNLSDQSIAEITPNDSKVNPTQGIVILTFRRSIQSRKCNESVLEEHGYPAPQNPYEIIKMIKNLSDQSIAEITPKLLNGLPNTYAYSKALTEDLINNYEKKLPIIVVRPSIVTAALEEPLPGWIEGVNGPTGLMIGAARGVIRSMHCNPDYASTVIPVDKAINGMIVAAYNRALSERGNVEFCNLCGSNKGLISWGESIETGKRLFYETPLSFALWYPDGSIKKNYYLHMICVVFFHYLPAYFIDFFLLLFARKPFLVRVQNKISTGLKLLQYYTTKDWTFKNEIFRQQYNKLNRIDQHIFNMDVTYIHWEHYIRNYINGVRIYIMGESEATLPQAKRNLRRLYILDRLTTYGFYAIIFWLLWTYVDTWMERSDEIIQNALQKIYFTYQNGTFDL